MSISPERLAMDIAQDCYNEGWEEDRMIKYVLSFLASSLVFAIHSSFGDEAGRRTAAEVVCKEIMSAPLHPMVASVTERADKMVEEILAKFGLRMVRNGVETQ